MGVYPGLLQRLLLAQCPGGEQALAGAAEHVLRQLCHADARPASEPVPGPQPGQQRLSGEYLADDAGRLRDDPAGDGDVNVAGGDGAAERGQPHRLHRHADLGCLGGEHPAQVRRKYVRRRRGDADADGPGLSAGARLTAAVAAAMSSKMVLDRAGSSAPAPVSATRRVVRLNRGVPSSRSSRRVNSLSVGWPR